MSRTEEEAVVLVIADRVTPADLSALYARLRPILAERDACVIVCDVGALVDPDAGTIDALARLQLTARRCGRRVLLRHGSEALQDLLALTGLSEVLRAEPGSGRGAERQPEEREQRGGVEEEGDPADPIP